MSTRTKSIQEFIRLDNSAPPSPNRVGDDEDNEPDPTASIFYKPPSSSVHSQKTSFTSSKTNLARLQSKKFNTGSDVFFFFCKNISEGNAKVVLRIEQNGFSWIAKPTKSVLKDKEALNECFDGVEIYRFEVIKEFLADKLKDNFTLVLSGDEEIGFKTHQVDDIVKAIADIMENKQKQSKKGKKKGNVKVSKPAKKKIDLSEEEEEEEPVISKSKKKKKNKLKMVKNQYQNQRRKFFLKKMKKMEMKLN